ncbi:putative pantothenate transporter [Xylariomycetidae sp. FL2044]|nr:putative pantothenate transporter [Xylariomycetidae sp. FL2044]
MDNRSDDNASSSNKPTHEAVEMAGPGEQSDADSEHSFRKQERQVKRKIDFIILPLLASVYFLSQMGRSDLNNAKIAGLDVELGLSDDDYSNVASLFYVGYLVFQLPGTLLLRMIGPPTQFAGAMLAWGVITSCTMLATSAGTLIALRTLTGAAEAFVQGTILYLSFWYRYDELAFRGAIIYSTSALAGSFNGLIGYAIQKNLHGYNGWSAWQWIFFIEGLVPIAWSFVIFFTLPPTPETVRLGFTPEEKTLVLRRSRAAHNTGRGQIRSALIGRLLLDYKFWLLALIDAGSHFCVSSISNFMGDILAGLTREDAEDSVRNQLLTVVVYAVSFVGILLAARVSDRLRRRGYVISACCAVGVVGYALLLALTDATGRLVATCVVAFGCYSPIVLTLAWTATNNPGYTYRASAAALINVFAQAVAIGGNQAFEDPPYYRVGLGASLAMIAMSGLVSLLLVWVYGRENEKKKRRQDSPEADANRGKSIDEIGNRHPDFFYVI